MWRAILLVVWLLPAALPAAEPAPDTVVAYVGQKPIRYEKIRVDSELLRLRHAQHRIKTSFDSEEATRKAELKKLCFAIRSLVNQSVQDRLGVTVPDQEVEEELRNWKRDILPLAKKSFEQMATVLAAVTAVYEGKMDKAEAYRSLPKDIKMSEHAWAEQLIVMRDPKRREALRRTYTPEELIESQRKICERAVAFETDAGTHAQRNGRGGRVE